MNQMQILLSLMSGRQPNALPMVRNFRNGMLQKYRHLLNRYRPKPGLFA